MNFFSQAIQEIEGIEDKSVLSLGCGVMQELKGFKCYHLTGIDIYKPYLDKLEQEGFVGRLVHADITKINVFESSFDVVMAYDVLEHLSELDAAEMLLKMKSWARHSVWVFTPANFVTNEHIDNFKGTGDLLDYLDKEHPDWKGTGRNEYQLHKSLVTQDMLTAAGYTVITPFIDRGYLWAFYKK